MTSNTILQTWIKFCKEQRLQVLDVCYWFNLDYIYVGVEKIIVTGGNLEMSRKALEVAESDVALFSTVGVHPTRCNEFAGRVEAHLQNLLEIAQEGIQKGKVVAIGECGLGNLTFHTSFVIRSLRL